MVSSELLRKGVTKPPRTAVKMPAIGGKPEAMEMPRHKGNAIKKTRNPETRSCFQ
jgi:hypothetical protein